MVRIALTSIPPRFAALGDRVEAMLAQRPSGVTVTIPHRYSRFPDWTGDLPALPAGVEVLRAPDRGPATKFLGVLARHPDMDILLADDDCLYGPGWLAAFCAARATDPGAVVAASTFDSGRVGVAPGHLIVQGFAGIMFRPDRLRPDVVHPDPVAQWVDDIWLSAHIAAAGLRILPCAEARAHVTPMPAPDPLQGAQVGGMDRAALNREAAVRLRNDLGIWRNPVPPT